MRRLRTLIPAWKAAKAPRREAPASKRLAASALNRKSTRASTKAPRKTTRAIVRR
jgi:hypothetical protein